MTLNSLHLCIKVLFYFAKSRGYLPQSEATAAELLPIAKEGETKTEIFQPAEMTKLLASASPHIELIRAKRNIQAAHAVLATTGHGGAQRFKIILHCARRV